MKFLIRLSFVIILLYQCGKAQKLEDLSVTVVYLRQGDSIGTGFLVADDKMPYLVTAKHVSTILHPNSVATVRDSNDVPYSFLLSQVSASEGKLLWYYHPEADVAVIPLLLKGTPGEKLVGRFIPVEMLQKELKAPQRERPLVVMGFPLALGTTAHFSPITSESKSASGLVRIQPPNEPEQTFFLLDKPSIGGFSGAPVFLMPWPFTDSPALNMPNIDEKASIVGLVKGTISDETGGKLALIVPIHYVLQTINLIK